MSTKNAFRVRTQCARDESMCACNEKKKRDVLLNVCVWLSSGCVGKSESKFENGSSVKRVALRESVKANGSSVKRKVQNLAPS